MKHIKIILFLLICSISMNISTQTTEQKIKDGCLSVIISEKRIAPQRALTIKEKVQINSLNKKMGEMYDTLISYIRENKIQTSGTPFAVYYSNDSNMVTLFESAVPVSDELETIHNIIYKEYPAMKVLSAVHVGPYSEINLVFNEIKKYAKKNNIILTNEIWEYYLVGPEIESDPEKYKTIVYFPLKEHQN